MVRNAALQAENVGSTPAGATKYHDKTKSRNNNREDQGFIFRAKNTSGKM